MIHKLFSTFSLGILGIDAVSYTHLNPRLAQDFEKAYAVLYHLALRQVSPIHLEDVLGDMEL